MSESTVFISGEGIGIGKGMAEAFAEARYRVIVTDVLVDEGTRVVSALTGSGADAEFHEMNVTDTAQLPHWSTTQASPPETIPLSAMTDDQWDLTIDVDLKGMMRSPSIRQPEARLPW